MPTLPKEYLPIILMAVVLAGFLFLVEQPVTTQSTTVIVITPTVPPLTINLDGQLAGLRNNVSAELPNFEAFKLSFEQPIIAAPLATPTTDQAVMRGYTMVDLDGARAYRVDGQDGLLRCDSQSQWPALHPLQQADLLELCGA